MDFNGILLGIFLAHLITFIVCLLFQDNEDIPIIVGSFLIFVPYYFLGTLLKKIRIWYIRKYQVPVALSVKYDWKNGSPISNKQYLDVYRVNKRKLKKYKCENNPFIEYNKDNIAYYFIEQVEGKYVENAIKIDNLKKDKTNKKLSLKWIDKNLKN